MFGPNDPVYIVNRHGEKQPLNLKLIEKRLMDAINQVRDLHKLEFETFNHHIDKEMLLLKVYQSIEHFTTTSELDELIGRVCMNMALDNYIYGYLGSYIVISNLQRNITESFLDFMLEYMLYFKPLYKGIIWKQFFHDVQDYIDPTRDFNLDYFGFKTLQRSYLWKSNDGQRIVETPQYLFMRVALTIHVYYYKNCVDITNNDAQYLKEKVFATYDLMSQRQAVHATPTLFNAGLFNRMNLSSCFLVGSKDSVESIFETVKNCALISKHAGGIGIHISNIRAKGALIHGGGKAEGVLKMMKVYNDLARYINQGSKRKGSIAVYLEPWHADIYDFLNAMKPHGDEETLCRDLFFALWLPDHFMSCVENNESWYLMTPNVCDGLVDKYGSDFTELYKKYVKEGKYTRKVEARKLWHLICACQIESGMPYMLYKDHVNYKSNQKNGGTIKSSNLCAEIVQLSDHEEHGVCNLASICLPKMMKYPEIIQEKDISKIQLRIYYPKDFLSPYLGKVLDMFLFLYEKEFCKNCKLETRYNVIKEYNDVKAGEEGCIQLFNLDINEVEEEYEIKEFIDRFRPMLDHEKLRRTVHILVENLNRVIDINQYPTKESKKSNFNWRPIGIGVQGLADVFINSFLSYTDEKAKILNKEIFESIYYYALEKSCELARCHGSYRNYSGSPISQGILQFDLWRQKSDDQDNFDWIALKEKIQTFGVRNSLLISLMPTASTSQIMGCSECFEPITTNMYIRRTLSGEFIVLNKQLCRLLLKMGLWNEEIKQRIMYNRGSIQQLPNFPFFLKKVFSTSWELSKKDIISMAADRGQYVDQSQSLNLFVENCSIEKLTKIHFFGWKKGLKTGLYYLRTKSAANAQSFTIDPAVEAKFKKEEEGENDNQLCVSCSS